MKAKAGDLVRITFWDHVENGDVPMKCIVVGKVVKRGMMESAGKRRRFIAVQSWYFPPGTDEDIVRRNATSYAILQTTIESIDKLGVTDGVQ